VFSKLQVAVEVDVDDDVDVDDVDVDVDVAVDDIAASDANVEASSFGSSR
jgi:hypothetical protein